MRYPFTWTWFALWAASTGPGCTGRASTLEPAGLGASRIAELLTWMTVGSLIIWLAVGTLAVFATRERREPVSRRSARLLIVHAGVTVPTLLLAALLVWGLSMLPPLLRAAPPGSLRILVTGEQWWWRVQYRTAAGLTVDLANEIRLPVGQPVDFELLSHDVIHAFWIPALGGKVDMIPGHQNRLTLHPTRTGAFRGVCAEYCGTSHALMNFEVVVQQPQDFARWLANQAQPARVPADPRARLGQEVFERHGCGACHTVRGTEADGLVGPDLTHLGSRLSIAAGMLPADAEHIARWLSQSTTLKPDVHMPAFPMLPPEHLRALALYLDGLE